MNFPVFLRRIVGHSMAPHYYPNQIVVASRFKKPKIGDVVVARVNGTETIKRVIENEEGYVFLHGDNHYDSYDSRHYGKIHLNDVLGVVF